MKKRVKPLIFLLVLMVIVIIGTNLFFIRALGLKEIDDIHPDIPCENEYINEADILWVIPKYNGKSIADNKTWCNEIKGKGKVLGLHGLYHTYQEFGNKSKPSDLIEAVKIFEECFGYKPLMFKPPQLKISQENKETAEDLNMKVKVKFNAVTHKIYHCNNSGRLSNEFIKAF